MAISFFVIVISVGNFSRLSNTGCIRAIHVVTLLVCGMGIGALLMNFVGFLRERKGSAPGSLEDK
jgi:high-affinity K+ transport system ATPase subunit B